MSALKSYNCIIEIDCAPFNGPRPNDIFEIMLNSTLEKSDKLDKDMVYTIKDWKQEKDNCSRFKGKFSWRLPYTLTEEQFKILKDEMWLELTSLFSQGMIRYGYIGTDGPPSL